MTYKLDSRLIGYPPIEIFLPAAGPTAPADVTPWPPCPPGFLARAEDPVWGPGEFVFAKAGATIRPYAPCVLTPVWNATNRNYDWNATEVPNTTLLGRMLGVCMSEQGVAATALTVGQFGWFAVSGLVPILSSASVAADTTCAISAAGQVGALAAGKQLVNARVMTPATQTVVVASVSGDLGGNTINLANVDGFIVGGYVSGTGVGAAAIILAIDRGARQIRVSVVNSALVTGNITCTYNNATIFYNVIQLNRVFAQGAIT